MVITPSTEILCQDHFVADKLQRTPLPIWIQESDYQQNLLENSFKFISIENQINVADKINFNRFVYRILNDSDVQQDSTLNISWDPSYQTIKLHFIHVYRQGKCLDKLNKAKIHIIQREENANQHLYNGASSALIFLDDIQESDVIDYAYSIEGTNPVFASHFCHSSYLQFSEPVQHYYLRILAPKNYRLFAQNHHTDLLPSILANDDHQEWVWKTHYIDAHHSETNQPEWMHKFSQLQISSFETWPEVVDWGLSFYHLHDDLTTECCSDMLALAQQWKQNHAAPDEQALQALRFVQDKIRYLGFEQGVHSFKPHPPKEVFEKRFGDCKDKVQLLRTFLKLMDIESYPVLVNLNLTQSLTDYHPSPIIFNHVILLIQIDGKEYWVDPTMNYQGGSLSKTYCRPLKYGLVLKEGTHALSPISSSTLANTSLDYTFLINEGESAILKILTIYHDKDADTFRNYYKKTHLKKVTKDFETYYSGVFGTLKVNEPMQMEDDRINNQITLTQSYFVDRLLKVNETGRTRGFLVFPLNLRSRLNATVEPNRQSPLQHEFPFHVKETYYVVKPKGESWKPQCEKHLFEDQAFKYMTTVDTEQETMKFSFDYSSLSDHIKPEEMEKHRDLLVQSLAHSFYQIQLGQPLDADPLFYWKSWFSWLWLGDETLSVWLLFLILFIRTLFRIF